MNCYFRVATLVTLTLMALSFPARADEQPAKMFIPFSATYKNFHGSNASALPRFFPLSTRPMGKPAPHNVAVTAEDDDIPTPHDGAPEAMTKSQAKQILSIFGAGE